MKALSTLFFALACVGASAARYDVCNDTKVEILVAYALESTYQDSTFGTFHTGGVSSKGWVSLAVGECKPWEFFEKNHSAYFYAKDRSGKGYFAEKNTRRFCVMWDDNFDHKPSEMVEPVKAPCKIKGEFGVPFTPARPGRFAFR